MLQAGDKSIETVFVQLYMAILLGFLLRSCPELRKLTQLQVSTPRLIADLQTGLAFYVSNHAMEPDSIARMHTLIQNLT
jgi:hypothetical protein